MDYQNAEFYKLNKNNPDLVYNFADELITYRKEEDENGNLHHNTPDIYVIKKGRVVAEYQGVVEGADDPENALNSAQEKELRETLDGLLSKLR